MFSVDAGVSCELNSWKVAVNAYNLTSELNYDASFSNRDSSSAKRFCLRPESACLSIFRTS